MKSSCQLVGGWNTNYHLVHNPKIHQAIIVVLKTNFILNGIITTRQLKIFNSSKKRETFQQLEHQFPSGGWLEQIIIHTETEVLTAEHIPSIERQKNKKKTNSNWRPQYFH